MLEAAGHCFVVTLGWRSTGLSFNLPDNFHADGPWYKENVYAQGSVGGAGGVMKTDYRSGLTQLAGGSQVSSLKWQCRGQRCTSSAMLSRTIRRLGSTSPQRGA